MSLILSPISPLSQIPSREPFELEGRKDSLLGHEKKSYHLAFFTRLDHGCINFKKSYHAKTDDTWKGGMTAKVIVVISKTVVITALTLLKVLLIITLITPIALKCLSIYKNRLVVDKEVEIEQVLKPVEGTVFSPDQAWI